MNELLILIFTMEGCPHCKTFKNLLNDNDIKYSEMDINEYPEEYEMFMNKTDNNEYVPAMMIFEIFDNHHKTYCYAPDRDYDELEDAIEIIQNHRRNFDL